MSRAVKSVRNRDLSLWSSEQLKQRFNECQKMEKSVPANKARRSWKEAKQEVENELQKRFFSDELDYETQPNL